MIVDDFDTLPDVTPRWGSEVRTMNGVDVRVPVLIGRDAALVMGPSDGSVTDPRDGSTWMVGWLDGVRVKRRAPGF